ncbi:PAS domain S-box protein [Phormidesmis priestleyi]
MSLKRLNQIVDKVAGRVSLRTALTVPFVLQIFAVAGLLGYLSFRNGQKAVNDVATQLRSEISDRIKQNLDTYLDTPHRINQSNINAIRLGELDVRNFAKLEDHFWHQLTLFDRVTVIGYANQDRELVAAERQSNHALTIRVSGRATGYDLRTYTTNQQGQRLTTINVGKHYNPHKRSWYQTPLHTGKQSWSEIYPHVTGETLYLGASQPVYSQNGSVAGVLLSNLNLLQLGAFLRSLNIGKTGQSFIIERSGLFVATSTAEAPFQITNQPVALPEDKIIRLNATASRDALTQATAKYLVAKFGDFHTIKMNQQIDFTMNHQRQFLQVLPFRDDRGIDWLIVVVIPEADFMEQIDLNTRTTVLLCLAALIASVLIGILTTRWITQPIVSVSRSAKALAEGEWEQTVDIKRTGDLGEMARSFNQMARQMRASFAAMQSLNKALSESESRLKQFLEAVPVGIAVLDASGSPYYINARATQLLGKGASSSVTLEQIPAFYEVYIAGTAQICSAEALTVVRALKGERTTADNLEIHQGDKIIPIETWGTPVFAQDGTVEYAIAAFQDITQRKQAEAALQESAEKYRLLFEHNPNPMWLYDAQSLVFLMVNDAAVQYYGYSIDEFLTMTILDIQPSSVVSRFLHHVSHIRSEPSAQSSDWQHRKKDGAVVDVEVTSRAIAWSGIAARCVLVKDITERKQADRLLANYNRTLEQQVAERTAALQESEAALRGVYDELRLREQELRLITDALPVCIFYTTPNHRYRFVNQTCEIWFGCSRDEILGRHSRELLGESAYQVVEPYIKQALGGQITTYEAELSYPSGKKHISAIYIPDFDANDQVRGYYGLITDISDRKRAEEVSILEERNRMAREIHDTLAQAFTSIIVHLDAAAQRIPLDPDAAQSHLKTGRTLARSGLADARRSVEALRPQILEEGDLHSALTQFAAQMFSHTSVQVVCEAIGEPNALPKEVEMNLLRIGQEALTNAFKYANASEVRVELRYEKSQCILQIKDNGQGFESSSLTVGRGFGLLGITERAERIGAELSIQSHLGQGTEITVRV